LGREQKTQEEKREHLPPEKWKGTLGISKRSYEVEKDFYKSGNMTPGSGPGQVQKEEGLTSRRVPGN